MGGRFRAAEGGDSIAREGTRQCEDGILEVLKRKELVVGG